MNNFNLCYNGISFVNNGHCYVHEYLKKTKKSLDSKYKMPCTKKHEHGNRVDDATRYATLGQYNYEGRKFFAVRSQPNIDGIKPLPTLRPYVAYTKNGYHGNEYQSNCGM